MFEIYIHYYYRYDMIKNHPDIFSIQYYINDIEWSGMLLFADNLMNKVIDLQNIIFVKYVKISYIFLIKCIIYYMI